MAIYLLLLRMHEKYRQCHVSRTHSFREKRESKCITSLPLGWRHENGLASLKKNIWLDVIYILSCLSFFKYCNFKFEKFFYTYELVILPYQARLGPAADEILKNVIWGTLNMSWAESPLIKWMGMERGVLYRISSLLQRGLNCGETGVREFFMNWHRTVSNDLVERKTKNTDWKWLYWYKKLSKCF